MAGLRFLTVADLYAAFPTAAEDVGHPADGAHTLTFLNELIRREHWQTAVTFCAYLLSRREAVWWGCQSLKTLRPDRLPQDSAAIAAAETWVREPDDGTRREALRLGMTGDTREPGPWMALGAGWSGGSLVPPELGSVMPERQQTARAVRTGLLLELTRAPIEAQAGTLRTCLSHAVSLAGGGDGTR